MVDGYLLAADYLRLGVLGECICGHEVDRQHEVAALGFGLLQHRLRRFDPVGLDDRCSDFGALRDEERERHSAADEQHVDAVDQTVDDAELVADLAAAEDRDERTRGIGEHVGERLDFAREQQTRVRRAGSA